MLPEFWLNAVQAYVPLEPTLCLWSWQLVVREDAASGRLGADVGEPDRADGAVEPDAGAGTTETLVRASVGTLAVAKNTVSRGILDEVIE